ncbi:MAG: MmcQ/YjbR family DNA-binding protein [Beijerinckiaceae bacterium]|jgi:hypothetical protein|nr:MmcQ/YjbR family DNA-binding protein [Beijerinckiaceae bacterium]
MSSAEDFNRLALGFKGTVAGPHHGHTGYGVNRIYAVLAADGATANFKFSREEQRELCTIARDTFTPVAGGFGKKGWTIARLDRLPEDELANALLMAWQHARPRRAPKD